jgi:hypothetical protein
VSSINPRPTVPLKLLANISRSSLAKSRKRIGDRGEPWGMPVCVVIVSLVKPLNVSRVDKESIDEPTDPLRESFLLEDSQKAVVGDIVEGA